MTEPASEAGAPDAAAYNDFVNSVTLASINLVAIGGERTADGEASRTNFEANARYQAAEGAVHYRFDVAGRLTDEANVDYGRVNASVIVTIAVTSLAVPVCIERFGSTTATMMAHPYLREALASTANRLGFPGVLLPMITQQAD